MLVCLVDLLVDPLVESSVDLLVDPLMDPLVDPMVDPMVDPLCILTIIDSVELFINSMAYELSIFGETSALSVALPFISFLYFSPSAASQTTKGHPVPWRTC